MSNCTYFAIRKPSDLKGVYSDEAQVKKMKKKVSGVEGASFRNFNKNQKEEALKWVDVKGLADEKQVSVSKVQKVKAVEKVKVKTVYQEVCEQYAKDGSEVISIVLVNGSNIYITTSDILSAKPYSASHIINNVYETYTDSGSNERKRRFSERGFNNYKNYLHLLKKTELVFMQDGINLDGYDINSLKEDCGVYSHSGSKVFIPHSAILMIKPAGAWTKISEDKRINDEELLKEYKKYLKSK